ncbi:uncharacterized protein [Saccopteryx bilineata]|uniref:uncharacterized protein n=1 Tax=Saccopteryx bilineata TaxID=59482 RepID=UPI00338E9F5B
MGQQESTLKSPFDCILSNFSDFQKRAQGYGGPPPDRETLQTLSQVEWPSLKVGWPSEGTFDLPIVFAVRAIIYQVPHPDQYVYIDIWIDIATDKPGYIKRCIKANQKVKRAICVSAADIKPRPPSAPPAPEKEPPKSYLVLPDVTEDIVDPVNYPPPYQKPREPDSTVPENVQSPPHTRGGTPYAQPPFAGSAPMLPLREVLPPLDEGPHAPSRMIYIPFSTSDLYNWKQQTPSFSEKPQGLISLLETVFRTHQPTWDDCQQLLHTLFTTEERTRIGQEAEKVFKEDGGTERELERMLPRSPPSWDPNNIRDRKSLTQYCRVLLREIKAAAKKPTNFSKVGEVIQGRDESPAAYLEQLMEAYRVYTPIDPEAEENRRLINIAFVTQATPDIRKKLQKIEGFEGKNRSELLENIESLAYYHQHPPAGRWHSQYAAQYSSRGRERKGSQAAAGCRRSGRLPSQFQALAPPPWAPAQGLCHCLVRQKITVQ